MTIKKQTKADIFKKFGRRGRPRAKAQDYRKIIYRRF